MELHLKITGFLFLLLAGIHVWFPGRFLWKQDLQAISLINRQMMYVHTFFVALVVFLMGLLCIFCSHDLVHTPFGKTISGGLFVFWLIRLYVQFFAYSSALWKGKRFETWMHIIFVVIWTYVTLVFLFAAFYE